MAYDFEMLQSIGAIYKYAFEKALEAFVETKNLLYIQKCASFLLESGNQNIKSLIAKWASGSVTDDEISINAAIGYKKEDIIDWAKQFNDVYGRGLIGEETSGTFRTYHFDHRGNTVDICGKYQIKEIKWLINML